MSDTPNKNIKALAWKAKLDVPMAVLAVIWVVVIATSLILDQNNPIVASLEGLEWGIWFLFLVEYFALIMVAEEKIYYIRQNALDFVIIFLPMLRILRIARALEIFKSATVFSETLRELSLFLHHKRIYHLLFLGFFVVAMSGMLIHLVEASRNPIFEPYAYSFVWAFISVLTFGHNSVHPMSIFGQAIEAGLILFEIGFLLYFVFTLISWLTKRKNALKT